MTLGQTPYAPLSNWDPRLGLCFGRWSSEGRKRWSGQIGRLRLHANCFIWKSRPTLPSTNKELELQSLLFLWVARAAHIHILFRCARQDGLARWRCEWPPLFSRADKLAYRWKNAQCISISMAVCVRADPNGSGDLSSCVPRKVFQLTSRATRAHYHSKYLCFHICEEGYLHRVRVLTLHWCEDFIDSLENLLRNDAFSELAEALLSRAAVCGLARLAWAELDCNEVDEISEVEAFFLRVETYIAIEVWDNF